MKNSSPQEEHAKKRAETMSSTANSNLGIKESVLEPKKENLKGVYLLAICFFILFFAVGACMSLMGSIFD